MKPRLLKSMGLWYCGIPGTGCRWGMGYTPEMAYAEWKAKR
jgi:hypothetical protein